MIRKLALAGLVILTLGLVSAARAQNYPLATGENLYGEPVHLDASGVVFKKPDGSLTMRVAWTNFAQPALKTFAKDPKAKPYVEALLEVEEEIPPALVKKAAPNIKITLPTRLDRPDPKAGWADLFSSPLALVLLGLIYLANLYAAYEIALFRGYHPGLGMGVAAVAPVISPALFLCLPTHVIMGEEIPVEETLGEAAQVTETAPVGVALAEPVVRAVPAKSGTKLPPTIVFRRGDTMFNRRFFETKLAGFLRMVPSETEKDMLLVVKSARGAYTGPRIIRLGPNELQLQIAKGGATSDVIIPFNEIQEVTVRHKDA